MNDNLKIPVEWIMNYPKVLDEELENIVGLTIREYQSMKAQIIDLEVLLRCMVERFLEENGN